MSKVAVCVPSLSSREKFLEELLTSLRKQTFTDVEVIVGMDVTPVGKAKKNVVERALKTECKYICMIDDDDFVKPTYIEEVVKRLDKRDVDWVFTWGWLFGDKKREGYIHGEIQTLTEIRKWNGHPAWVSAKRKVFEKVNFDETIEYIDDWDLWIKILENGFKGAVIEKELYMKRWHKNSLMGMRSD